MLLMIDRPGQGVSRQPVLRGRAPSPPWWARSGGAPLPIFPRELLLGGSRLGGMLVVGWLWSALQPVRAPQQAARLQQGPPKSPDLSAVTICRAAAPGVLHPAARGRSCPWVPSGWAGYSTRGERFPGLAQAAQWGDDGSEAGHEGAGAGVLGRC